MMTIYIAIKPWTTEFTKPTILTKGQVVIVDYKESLTSEWPNWAWCITQDNQGWVPIQILEKKDSINADRSYAQVTEDYSAQEINVALGDIIEGRTILNGWLWGTNHNQPQTDWLPLDCLAIKGIKDPLI